MILKPGQKLTSAVCDTQVVVVRPPAGNKDLNITCGGLDIIEGPGTGVTQAPPADAPATDPALIGKRYEDVESGIEVLCTRGGRFLPAVEGRILTSKQAKAIPSSD